MDRSNRSAAAIVIPMLPSALMIWFCRSSVRANRPSALVSSETMRAFCALGLLGLAGEVQLEVLAVHLDGQLGRARRVGDSVGPAEDLGDQERLEHVPFGVDRLLQLR